MSDAVNPREIFTTEEGVLANMWAMEAIVELIERKGICTKQEVHDMVSELRKRHGDLSAGSSLPRQYIRLHRSLNRRHLAALYNFVFRLRYRHFYQRESHTSAFSAPVLEHV